MNLYPFEAMFLNKLATPGCVQPDPPPTADGKKLGKALILENIDFGKY